MKQNPQLGCRNVEKYEVITFLSKTAFQSLPGTMDVLCSAAVKLETIGMKRTDTRVHMCTQESIHIHVKISHRRTEEIVSTSQTEGVCELQLASPHVGSQEHHF